MENTFTKITKAILQKTIASKKYVTQDFFVGLTDNPKKKLFLEHKVDRETGLYTYFEADSTEEAKKAYEELFKMDMNGIRISSSKSGKYVYCYHINGLTVECPGCN